MTSHIENPILTGFNPDPSIIRVCKDYYIATSTFEWFPGVQIHHSRDLKNWELIARPLDRISQLDMKGNKASGGVWAPCLSYQDGTFYLVYTNMRNTNGRWRDLNNYLVTTQDITGDWSEPIYLNSSGFDPSLFHDQNTGRKWLVNMIDDHRGEDHADLFAGIVLQEYSEEQEKLVGSMTNIFAGTELEYTEGPHLYYKNGYYYLIVAEGGTGYGHAVTMARSRNIDGPYEVHPENPILTSRNNPELELQKAGHADIISTPNNEWYLVHLCGRPLSERGRCTLGRETAIQKVEWRDDGWLYLEKGDKKPHLKVPAPDLSETEAVNEKIQRKYYDFSKEELPLDFQTLRIPLDENNLSLKERPGYLRLKGQESLNSCFHQSLVVRRWKDFQFSVETSVEFSPENYKQMAGLVCYYDEQDYYYLRLTHDEKLGRCLGVVSCNQGENQVQQSNIELPDNGEIYLKVEIDYDELQFYYSIDDEDWTSIGPVLDASKLSDEYSSGRFTGSFVGLCCQDLSGKSQHADFNYFIYQPKN